MAVGLEVILGLVDFLGFCLAGEGAFFVIEEIRRKVRLDNEDMYWPLSLAFWSFSWRTSLMYCFFTAWRSSRYSLRILTLPCVRYTLLLCSTILTAACIVRLLSSTPSSLSSPLQAPWLCSLVRFHECEVHAGSMKFSLEVGLCRLLKCLTLKNRREAALDPLQSGRLLKVAKTSVPVPQEGGSQKYSARSGSLSLVSDNPCPLDYRWVRVEGFLYP
uniref:Uncharacterized protein n=1 Tax=Palpitomonas bilix TaxID=652834 RepID=A0A7S3GKJ8_9EUKA|mmetsp:Transcript_7320/g.19002  ORF Transcript_7320/g.19002 Transcript_7320/m.19002 type:complete len:217 (+) Transcript_7320:375-1025(+)